MGKVHALGGKRVDVWGYDLGVTRVAVVAMPPLIGKDVKYVWFGYAALVQQGLFVFLRASGLHGGAEGGSGGGFDKVPTGNHVLDSIG